MKSEFQKCMERTAVVSAAATVLLLVCWHFMQLDAVLSLTITAGVTCYHFSMRLLVGYLVSKAGGRIDPAARWFVPRKWEAPLYRFLKLRKWKHRVPTYRPESFDLKLHTPAEIIRTMCVSEVVHEVIILFSFLPVALYIPFGSPEVFVLTSIGAALTDSIFAMLQRHNRPRLARLLQRFAEPKTCPRT